MTLLQRFWVAVCLGNLWWGIATAEPSGVAMSLTPAVQNAAQQPVEAPDGAVKPPLSIAVAANFAGPLQVLLPAFEQASGINTRVTAGSSGALYAQIQHGAPYDVFLSADSMRPRALVNSGKISADAVTTYTIGQLALVGNVTGLTDAALLTDTVRIAIADPGLAPYGRAAQELLEALGIWSALQSRLIRGNNVQQTLQFWQTGNVDVALIAGSQCITYQLDCKPVPALYEPVVQQMAVVASNQVAQAEAARSLARYLRSEAVQQQLTAMGYRAVTDITSRGGL
ncbi:molybdate ABC transporter substrate-binding protein [Alteromonas gilva]|uniref:Molybdate ABC transporter substrate-binding protein n=1 Tax=Alteromonas gilva TaxID=2987522 RepID=A0ABT5L1H9_9ALTE|nr:molybdate ABC transporter substrate-binding protein [Alteromonas gilva]MDC8830732.1 molybdate ABC transporter substrate-binding protein [Alteromonas gilva]